MFLFTSIKLLGCDIFCKCCCLRKAQNSWNGQSWDSGTFTPYHAIKYPNIWCVLEGRRVAGIVYSTKQQLNKLIKCENDNNKHHIGSETQLAWNAYSRPRFWSIESVILIWLCYQGLLVGLCVQDYKSLCAAVTICATLVNIQTHRQTDTLTAFWAAYVNSSTSRAKNQDRTEADRE